jgi:hypothetical protein
VTLHQREYLLTRAHMYKPLRFKLPSVLCMPWSARSKEKNPDSYRAATNHALWDKLGSCQPSLNKTNELGLSAEISPTMPKSRSHRAAVRSHPQTYQTNPVLCCSLLPTNPLNSPLSAVHQSAPCVQSHQGQGSPQAVADAGGGQQPLQQLHEQPHSGAGYGGEC